MIDFFNRNLRNKRKNREFLPICQFRYAVQKKHAHTLYFYFNTQFSRQNTLFHSIVNV